MVESNLMRFVNDYETHNCEALHIPIDNLWKVIYVTTKAINPGQELSVSYGPNYWKTRE